MQSPSWEANWFAASQEIPRISRNPKVHYRTHKRPPLSLSWASPIQSIYPHPTSWRSNLILSTHLRLGLPSGLFPSGFPTKTLYTPSPHPYAPHALPISFFSILSPAQYWVRSTKHLAPRYAISSIPPRYFIPPRSKYSPQHHVLKHPQLPFLPQYRPLTHTLIFTINVQVVYVFNGDVAVYKPPLQVLLIIHYVRRIVRMTCIIASYAGSHGFEFLSLRLHILPDIHWPSSVPSRICRDRVMHHVTTPPFHILSTSLFIIIRSSNTI